MKHFKKDSIWPLSSPQVKTKVRILRIPIFTKGHFIDSHSVVTDVKGWKSERYVDILHNYVNSVVVSACSEVYEYSY
jgi:hypothetical protein